MDNVLIILLAGDASSTRPRRFFRRSRVRTVQICGQNRMLLVSNALDLSVNVSGVDLSAAFRRCGSAVENLLLLSPRRAEMRMKYVCMKTNIYSPLFLSFSLDVLSSLWIRCADTSFYRLFMILGTASSFHFRANYIRHKFFLDKSRPAILCEGD